MALSGLDSLLMPDERLEWLSSLWDQGTRQEEDSLAMLALSLLSLEDDRGLSYLTDLALAGRTAVVPALDALYDRDAETALELMHLILERGDEAVQTLLAERIARRAAGLNASGISLLDATRAWVEAQRVGH
jgi:hypothetical protein